MLRAFGSPCMTQRGICPQSHSNKVTRLGSTWINSGRKDNVSGGEMKGQPGDQDEITPRFTPSLGSTDSPPHPSPSLAKPNIPNVPFPAPASPSKTHAKGGEGGGWVGSPRPRCPHPAHLHLLPDVLPVGEEVVERVLGVLHVAAVLAVNQQPGEGEITNLIGNTRRQL